MNYKSPIEVFYSDVQLKFEDGVYKAVQAVDIHVDRYELIKALQYDRQQYEKGWHDALLKEQETMMQCIKGKCRICPHCSNCDVDDNGELKEQEAVTPKVSIVA